MCLSDREHSPQERLEISQRKKKNKQNFSKAAEITLPKETERTMQSVLRFRKSLKVSGLKRTNTFDLVLQEHSGKEKGLTVPFYLCMSHFFEMLPCYKMVLKSAFIFEVFLCVIC